MHAFSQRLEHFNDCLFDCGFRVTFDFRQSSQLRLPLNQRNDGLLMVLADDRVGLPVAKPSFTGNDGWAIIKAFTVGQLAASVVFAITFAALFLTAEMMVEVAALLLVSIDVLIDAFVTDRRLALLFERAADLFRRPVLLKQGVNLLPGVAGKARGIIFRLAARVGQMLRLFGTIATLTAIAFEFARDSRGSRRS
jgi:hypothetical protein